MRTLKIHGRLDPTPEAPELARGLPDKFITPKRSAVLQMARAGAEPIRLEGLADDDVVEITLQDGIRVWTRVADLEEDFGIKPSRDAADGAIELPAVLRVGGGPSRSGVGDWAIKGLKVFGIDLPGTLASFVSRHVEVHLKPGPGLYRCTLGGPKALGKVGKVEAGGPTLVFLHGTASSTEGSFGALWQGGSGALIHRLFAAYPGRVLAFQHRTLTESPVENAVELMEELAKALPKGSALHLVSHSRGGLIGELLGRGMRIGAAPFDATDLARFAKGQEGDRKALETLGRLLAASQFSVERFVRVACPARGTTLADRRLDRYFSIMTNLVGYIPFLKGSGVYDGLTSLVAGVLKERTDAAKLPGLQAMMPESALVWILNRANVQTRADLHVIGGDLEGAGLLGRLKTLATDFYYLEDHDLVVNTPSMFGGVERAGGVKYWIDTGNEVTHFNYFRNADTANRLLTALQSPEEAGFRTFKHKTSDQVTGADYQKRAAGPQPVVFVVPGIMGTNLAVNRQLVWMNYLSLGLGGLESLGLNASKVTAESLVGGSYRKLLQHLALTHKVVDFPYDWRQSVENAAERLRIKLADEVKAAAAQDQPVRIVAHSMGGLVVRAMIATAKGRATWDEMCTHPGARLVMLGTPNGGSHSIAALVMGRDALVKKLALLDAKHSHAELMAIIAGFDGVLNLLPHGGDFDLYDLKDWERVHEADVPASERGLFSSSAATTKSAGFSWTVPDRAQLAAAARTRDLLQRSPIFPDRMIYVAGVAKETPCALAIDEKASAGRRVAVMATARGDGRVPWDSGIPKDLASRTYYMNAVHGDMANTEDAFPALMDLLTAGSTTKLSRTAPVSRGDDVWFPMRSPDPDMLPDADDILASAMGSSRGREIATATAAKVKVRIVHGSLSRAVSPVVVSHYYQGDFVSAEAYLDEQLHGRLTELHRMDLYPGKLGTAVVVLNDPGSGEHPGGIVVGLGRFGSLTAGGLANTLAHGLTMYGAERVAWMRRRHQRGQDVGVMRVPAPVSVLLIGSGEGGVTTLSDSLLAILRAVAQANKRLSSSRPGDASESAPEMLTAFIDVVDILELYEDRAIQAVRALNGLAASAFVRGSYVVQEMLTLGDEGQSRATYAEAGGWSQHIWIKTTRKGSLHFDAVTHRAAAASYVGRRQKKNAELFLDRAVKTTSRDVELGHLLFEMLVPPAFKETAPEKRALTLMLDRGAAALPWELLHDRYDDGSRPVAVETGMIRQLLVPETPDRRREALLATAVVIGNPPMSDPRFADLPGAEKEAAAVALRLSAGGYGVTSLLGAQADTRSVIAGIFEDTRILHLAGHGVFEFEPAPGAERVSGMVLGDGMFLTSELIEQMRVVPDLVFLNCCHLGALEGDGRPAPRFHRLAANLAEKFIRMGARAVVAAGWAVDDAAARDFAVRFYGEMLAGEKFINAVRVAREEIYEGHPSANTWGAYQCYGDAAFTLVPPRNSSGPRSLVAPAELAVLANNWAEEARAATDERREQILKELEEVVRGTRPEWLKDSTTAAAIARAYGELGELEKAVEHYEIFAKIEPARGPLRAVEQLANFLGRCAPKRPEAKQSATFARAEALLESLHGLGETVERYSLVGSLRKRKAIVAKDKTSRKKALRAMVDAYAHAYTAAGGLAAKERSYPLSNELSGRIALAWAATKGTRADRQAITEGLKTLERLNASIGPEANRFWDLSLEPDRLLLAAMSRQRLTAAARSEIVAGYRLAARRGRSQREMESVRDQVEFFRAMAADLKGPKGRRLVKDLEALRDNLAR